MKYLILAVFLTSCGAANQLRRAERLISKAEAGGAQWSVDTVYVNKEVIVPGVKLDTLVESTDTITVAKDNVVTKVKVNAKEVFIETTCLPDTVRIRVPVEIYNEIKTGKTGLQLIIQYLPEAFIVLLILFL